MSHQVSVLVVEDEALLRMGISDFLDDQGFRVLEASDAHEAIAMLSKHPEITVLFTDVDMPGGMDGLRLAAAVRDRWPPVKIIVTSGHRKAEAADMPEGAVFFSKPYNPDVVAATVRQLSF